ncbi:MAG: tetratricopeptide repeat protein, partial [Bdellovibrionales bacterium]|nr:tetratricopeptide repeat protein [Bdellovibrionales bacterium]
MDQPYHLQMQRCVLHINRLDRGKAAMMFMDLLTSSQRLITQGFLVCALIFVIANPSQVLAKQKGESRVEDELKLKAGDEMNNEAKSLKAEGLIEKTESQAMAQLEKLLKRYKGTAMESDLLFRKGELFMRRAKTIRFFELQRDSAGSHSASPVLKQTGPSSTAIEKAIATYEDIQKRFPDYRDVDLVLFNQGFALHSANRKKEAEKIYEKILERHPQSTWIPDTLLALGDLQFEKKDFKKAVAIYDRIRSYPDARVYPYGLYKAGWSRYNLEDAQAALKDLEAVVVHCNAEAEGESRNRLDLRKEALADMVLFFTEAHEAHKAYKYFRAQAGVHDVGFYLLKLSKLYERHSRFKDVEIVLNEYLDGVPNSPERPQARRDLIGIYDLTKQHRLGANQLEKLYEDCKDVLSQFSSAQKEHATTGAHIEPVTEHGCIQSTRESSAKMAAKWHRGWLKNRAQEDLALYSLRSYEIFLLTPREKEDTDDRRNALRFAYAELLFNRNLHRQAAKEYEVVARESTLEQTRHDANYAALVALEKAVTEKWQDPDEAKLKDLAKLYWTHHPQGKYGNDLKFKVAFVAYEKGRLNEAAG